MEEPARSARKAIVTRTYAKAVVDVGAESGSAVVDLWGAIMREVGWDGGDEMPGDRGVEKSALETLLVDGE